MDSFEAVIASILQRQGYWTRASVKVELTKEEKRTIGRPSSPRWELDVVGYRGASNEILVVECKSYLDSLGVQCATFDGRNAKNTTRYKLFFDETLRKVVLKRLRIKFTEAGFCVLKPNMQIGLAAGKVKGDEKWLEAFFKEKGWRFWGPTAICRELTGLRDSGYENSVASVGAKLLLRQNVRATPSNQVQATANKSGRA